MSQWKPVNKTWREYHNSVNRSDLVGRVIKLKSDNGAHTIIGDVNINGGYYDDCEIRYDDIVVAELDLSKELETLIVDAEPL